MTTTILPTHLQALLSGLSVDDVARLTQYLNGAEVPRQKRNQNMEDSKLLRLPQELRDHIIRMSIPDTVRVDPWGVSAETPSPTWLQVCSQLRLDAAKVYFSTPIYLPWVGDDTYKKWIDSIDVSYRHFVRSVHIDRFVPDVNQAIEYARNHDTIGRFREGTVWVPTSVGESGDATSIWINSFGKTQIYEELLPLEASLSSAIPDKYSIDSWV